MSLHRIKLLRDWQWFCILSIWYIESFGLHVPTIFIIKSRGESRTGTAYAGLRTAHIYIRRDSTTNLVDKLNCLLNRCLALMLRSQIIEIGVSETLQVIDPAVVPTAKATLRVVLGRSQCPSN